MDWATILTACKRNGYTGSDTDLAAVKAFVAENLDIEGKDGEVVDLDAVFAKASKSAKAKTKLILSDDGDELAKLTAERDAFRDQARKAASATVRGVAGDDDRPGNFFIANAAKKSFQHKINAGETYLKDADTAEVIGAFLKGHALRQLDATGTKAFLECQDICRKANVSYDFSSGGFAIPEVLSTQIIDIRGKYEALTELGVPIMPIRAQGESVSRITSGVTVYSPGEGVAATETEIAGDQVSLKPFEMVALSTVTNKELNASHFDFGNKVAERMRYAMMKKLEEIYFLGDGTSTYFNQRGILGKLQQLVTDSGGTWTTNAAYAAAITTASGAAWSNITYNDIQNVLGSIGMMENMSQFGLACSWQFYQQVLVPLSTGRGGAPASEIVNGIPRTWDGNRIVLTNAMPRASASASVCLHAGDFALGTKLGVAPDTISMSTSTERYWDQRKVGFQMALNYAINVHDMGNASATAASREDGPIASLITA
jgi:HK97 family phage major capsid protein